MRKVTPAETLSMFLGAGAESYSWYVSEKLTTEGADSADVLNWDNVTAWSCEFVMDDPDEGDKETTHTVTHDDIMRAVRKFAGKTPPKYSTDACQRACKDLIFRTDEADFDAATADEVLQVAMFGEVIYG